MRELPYAVIEKVKAYAFAHISEDLEATSPFLSVGLRYFQFAHEERPLFELLFVDGHIGISLQNPGQVFRSLLLGLKQDPNLQELPEESLRRLGTNMWIYLHGLTMLVYKIPTARARDFIQERLLLMGKTLIEWERFQNG